MKKIQFLFCLMISGLAYGQNDYVMNTSFSEEIQYLFKKFQTGILVFNNNTTLEARLNYNVLSEEMHFLDKGNIIKSLAVSDIDHIEIGQYSFYFKKGLFYFCFQSYGDIKLLQQFKPIFRTSEENTGAYGTSVASSTSTRVKSIRVGTKYSDEMVDVVVKPEDEIKIRIKFFVLQNESFYELNKKNLTKHFPEKEDRIKEFIKDNNVELSVKDDIILIFNEVVLKNTN